MFHGLEDILMVLPIYALVLFRISGLVLTAPIYGSPMIPMRIRAAFVIAMAAMLLPLLRNQVDRELTLAAILPGLVSEVMIGAGIGLGLTAFMMAGSMAGTVAGQQAGLALSRVVDPTQGEQVSVLGQVYVVILTLIFLAVGGHRAAIAAVLDTYDVIPLLSYRAEEPILLLLIETITAAFMLGFRLAGPVLIALFLSGIAMGFLSRTMPQFNILSVGFTFRTMSVIAVGGLALNVGAEPIVQGLADTLAVIRTQFGLDPTNLGLTG